MLFIVNAYKAGTCDQGIVYLNNSLSNRETYCEWSKELMGPIRNKQGVEQGGINSDKLYKLNNNIQIKEAQSTNLGIDIGSSVVSFVAQADDTGLMSNGIYNLQNFQEILCQSCPRKD